MQHDTPTTSPAADPTHPPTRLAGIDWATDTHALCIVDAHGEVLRELTTAADAAGLRRLVDELDRHNVHHVAIERPDGPVVDTLLGAGRTVVIITPRQVRHLRARYGHAGNKHDRFDAFVLADVLRTDGRRLQPLRPDTPQTTALRSAALRSAVRAAPTWSRRESRCATNSGRTCGWCSPARSGCSPRWTHRSVWPS